MLLITDSMCSNAGCWRLAVLFKEQENQQNSGWRCLQVYLSGGFCLVLKCWVFHFVYIVFFNPLTFFVFTGLHKFTHFGNWLGLGIENYMFSLRYGKKILEICFFTLLTLHTEVRCCCHWQLAGFDTLEIKFMVVIFCTDFRSTFLNSVEQWAETNVHLPPTYTF